MDNTAEMKDKCSQYCVSKTPVIGFVHFRVQKD